VIVRAYGSQLEGPGAPLPEGTFAAKYGLEGLSDADREARINGFRDRRVAKVYDTGGFYYTAAQTDDPANMLGYLKILPGRTTERSYYAGCQGIGEILVMPELQRSGVGSALLHAHARIHQTDRAPHVLEAFKDSEKTVNAWYRSLGFVHHGPADAFDLGVGAPLPMLFYFRPTASELLQRLEVRRPELKNVRVL